MKVQAELRYPPLDEMQAHLDKAADLIRRATSELLYANQMCGEYASNVMVEIQPPADEADG